MPERGSDTPNAGTFLAAVLAIEDQRLQDTRTWWYQPPDPFVVSHADALRFVPAGVRGQFQR